MRGKLRVLDFDTESRPLSYLGPDFTTSEVTAIAAGWCGKRDIHCWLIPETTAEVMLRSFVQMYDEADLVTGHFIRGHDLPRINGALMEHGLPPLGAKMASCTKSDLVKRSGISASQGNLAAMLGLSEPKQGMNQVDWRQANRLTPEGIEKTKKRVIQDVRQHRVLRAKLVELGLLGAPRLWNPS
jgi:hypothetical protein